MIQSYPLRKRRPKLASQMVCFFFSFASFLLAVSIIRNSDGMLVANAEEIEAKNEGWKKLEDNETVAPGFHIRMDLSTGEKWIKSDANENSAGAGIDGVSGGERPGSSVGVSVSSSSATAKAQVDTDGKITDEKDGENYDFDAMHRALSNLPPEEKLKIGLPEHVPDISSSKITAEQRLNFEKKMKEIWKKRQEELRAFQEEFLADLPQLLKYRIASIKEYLDDPVSHLKEFNPTIINDDDEESEKVKDILGVLRDLEYQLTDLDMTRDFYTLGGWPLLASLLADAVHESNNNATNTDEDWNKVNVLQGYAAWTLGTAVKNTNEFNPYAIASVEVLHNNDNVASPTIKTTPLDLVLAQFVASSRAIMDSTIPKDEYYDTVVMKVHKLVYALGAFLRGNRQAQTHFCADQGPALLGTILAELADRTEEKELPALSWDILKVAQRLLNLAVDIVMDVSLHPSSSVQVDGAIRNAFTSPQWCTTIVKFSRIPRLHETALVTIRQLAPHCREHWNLKAVQEQVKQPPLEVQQGWLPDDLDPEILQERIQLVTSTVEAILQDDK